VTILSLQVMLRPQVFLAKCFAAWPAESSQVEDA